MASSSPLADCFADLPPVAADVARGVTRLFCRHDMFAICEVPLPNGRRADLMAIDAKGHLVIVEIKVSKADLIGDGEHPPGPTVPGPVPSPEARRELERPEKRVRRGQRITNLISI